MIAAVVAVDSNWGIGANGELLERIPEDMKHFKELTDGHMVVMGRKTWESLPSLLSNRFHLILTRTPQNKPILSDRWFADFKEGLNMIYYNPSDVFIIGGGQIYKELLPICDYVYVTKIHKDHEQVDTYFPDLDNIPGWKPVSIGQMREYNSIKYQFCEYKKTIKDF